MRDDVTNLEPFFRVIEMIDAWLLQANESGHWAGIERHRAAMT